MWVARLAECTSVKVLEAYRSVAESTCVVE